MITQPNGERVDVAKLLKEHYSVFESARRCPRRLQPAFSHGQGVFPKNEYGLFATYLGGMFRSIRFGINEAHGGGVVFQFQLSDGKRRLFQRQPGTIDLDEQKMAPALSSWLTDC
jgi:hypothetical protein